MTEKEAIFVYGTLKKGQRANYKLAEEDFVGEAQTPPLFNMFGETYPMLTKTDKGASVIGEVYLVSKETMKELDRYEGFPSFYSRMQIPVAFFGETTNLPFDADTASVWIYYVRDPKVICLSPWVPDENGFLNWRPDRYKREIRRTF